MATRRRNTEQEQAETRLDSDTTKPSTTQPGDGPADTTDPSERAVSAPFNPDDEARRVGTVNAVVPAPEREAPARESGEDRWEEYEATRPNGETVTVRHNLDTGETSVS
jgi:hypothetical protein